jgi:hypothetical protein
MHEFVERVAIRAEHERCDRRRASREKPTRRKKEKTPRRV